jgi:hypothetical protein
VHEFDHGFEDGGVGFWQYAVSQVENMSRVRTRPPKNFAGRLAGDIGSRKAPSGIEVALYRPATNAPSSFVKIDVPINAHHGTSTGRHEVENLAGAHAKQNGGHSKVGDSFEDALGRR